MESIKHRLPPASQDLCLCRTIGPSLSLCRFFGLFPITTSHDHGHCVFRQSKLWIVWSLARIISLIAQLIYSTDLLDVFNIMKGKTLHGLLSAVTDILYITYILVLTVTNVARIPKFVHAFNKFAPLLHEGLLCNSARTSIRRTQLGVLAMITVIFSIQCGTLLYLNFSDNFISSVDITTFINRISQNITFLFYVLFMSAASVFIGILACFEKLTIYQLKYVPVHPEKGIEETNNTYDFMGIIKYKICKEVHMGAAKLKSFGQVNVIEYLRCLHEEVSLVMYDINASMNPQFLFHTMMELTVLIVHWYAVIIYFTYKSATPVDTTIHFLNCLFVFLHTFGLWVFLKTANQQHGMVQGLTNFLLEYATRISAPDEHQQVRLFIEKLKLHRPLTASGIFTIDLTIAGPVWDLL